MEEEKNQKGMEKGGKPKKASLAHDRQLKYHDFVLFLLYLDTSRYDLELFFYFHCFVIALCSGYRLYALSTIVDPCVRFHFQELINMIRSIKRNQHYLLPSTQL